MELNEWFNNIWDKIDLSKLDWSALVSIYSAALSTGLLIWTARKNRLRLFANLDTRVSTDGYFHANITSIYSKPIIINYYKIFLKDKMIDVGLYENCNFVIQPNTVSSIGLVDMYLSDFDKSGKLFLELYITGRSKPKKIPLSR